MSNTRPNEYDPDTVSPPGETLLETLEMRGMTQADLAARTGRTPKLINEIIKGKAPITADTALQFERVLGVSAEFWNNRESQYRESLSRQGEARNLAGAVAWLREFPVSEMVKLGWLPKRAAAVDQLRELLSFFGVASPSAWEDYWSQVQVSYRTSSAFNADQHALRAWLRRGELVGQARECAEYNAGEFRKALGRIRALTLEDPPIFQPRLIEMCAACGVAVAFVPELPKIRASGATRWLTPTKALLQVNLRHKKNDHFWFTVFHEAAHILNDSKKTLFVDTEKFEGENEEAANRFAAEQLVPQAELSRFAASTRPMSKAAIEAFARRQGIAPGIVVGQLQHHKVLPFTHCNDLKRTLVWA